MEYEALGNTINKKSIRPVLQLPDGNRLWANLDIPGRKPNILYIICLLMATLMAGGLYVANAGRYDRLVFAPQTICLVIILLAWFFHKLTGDPPRNWLSPDVLFISVFCVFHFGYFVFYVLGIAPVNEEVFWAPSKVLLAMFFSICCLVAFMIVYEIVGVRFQNNQSYSCLPVFHPTIMLAAKTLILIAIMFMWGAILSAGVGRVLSDHRTLLRIGGQTGGRFYWVSMNIGLVGVTLYCAISGLNYQKFMHGLIFPFVVFAYIFSILLLGSRQNFIGICIGPILAFQYFQRKIKLPQLIVGGLIIFFAMGVIAMARTSGVLKTAQTYKQKKTQSEQSLIVRTLISFGSSIKIVVAALELVPQNHTYWYGKSYTIAADRLIPNVIPGRVRQSEGPVYWLNEVAFGDPESTYGRGGSIVAETYMNFGFTGSILFFGFLGYWVRTLYEKTLFNPTFLKVAWLFGVCGAFMIWMRNTINIASRPIMWTLMVAWAIKLLFPSQAFEQSDDLQYMELEEQESMNDVYTYT